MFYDVCILTYLFWAIFSINRLALCWNFYIVYLQIASHLADDSVRLRRRISFLGAQRRGQFQLNIAILVICSAYACLVKQVAGEPHLARNHL
jgi:hypothetical protein